MAGITVNDLLEAGYTPRPKQDLNVPISFAQAQVDDVLDAGSYNAALFKKILTALAIYYAQIENPPIRSGSSRNKSATYEGGEKNKWLQAAIALDKTGTLGRAFSDKGLSRARLRALTLEGIG